MISSGSTGYDSKIWEHVKYWYDVQAWLPKNMVVVNKAAWEGLDETLQKVVLEAAANAEKAGWAKARELSDWYKEQIAARSDKRRVGKASVRRCRSRRLTSN